MAPFESITAPHKCRWLTFTDNPSVPRSNWTDAVCVRNERRQRIVVPALDCVGCRYWAAHEHLCNPPARPNAGRYEN